MATPVVVKLTCPLCQTAFQAKTMGSSYYIAGVDTDLRETGSIEDVRRYSVASCPCCGNTDYTWNLQAPDDLDEVERAALVEGLVDGTLVLEVSVTRDGEDAPDELVHVLDAAGHQLDARYTDRDGLAIFELPVGDVLVSASDVSVTARVSTVEVSRVDVELED